MLIVRPPAARTSREARVGETEYEVSCDAGADDQQGAPRNGAGARIARAVADRGINLRGASAACIGRKAVFYLAVESEQNLKEAMQAVRKLLSK